MNSNIGVQTAGTIAWDGTASFPGDLRRFITFGWSLEVTDTIAADAVFLIEAAPASDADACLPGTWEGVDIVPTCTGAEATGATTFTIPAGTPVGTICAVTLACKPNAFVRLVDRGGDTDNVRAVLLRQGPAF